MGEEGRVVEDTSSGQAYTQEQLRVSLNIDADL